MFVLFVRTEIIIIIIIEGAAERYLDEACHFITNLPRSLANSVCLFTYFWLLFNRPIFPRITSGQAGFPVDCQRTFGDCW